MFLRLNVSNGHSHIELKIPLARKLMDLPDPRHLCAYGGCRDLFAVRSLGALWINHRQQI